MKKCLMSVIGMVLSLAMMLSLASCGDPAKPFIGTWEGEMDFTTVLEQMLAAEESLEGMEFQFDDAKIKLIFTFGEDGSMTMKIDEASLRALMENLVEDVIVQTLQAMQMEMTVDEYLSLTNMTMDEMVDSMFADGSMTESFKEMEQSGTFKVEGDKLYLIAEDETYDAGVYTPFSFEGEALIMGVPVGETYENEEQQEMMESLFPMTFQKVA